MYIYICALILRTTTHPLLFNDKVINSKKKKLTIYTCIRSILKHYIKGKIN